MRGVQLRRLPGQPQRLPQRGGVRQQLRGHRGNLEGHVPPPQGAGTLQGQTAQVVSQHECCTFLCVIFPTISRDILMKFQI